VSQSNLVSLFLLCFISIFSLSTFAPLSEFCFLRHVSLSRLARHVHASLLRSSVLQMLSHEQLETRVLDARPQPLYDYKRMSRSHCYITFDLQYLITVVPQAFESNPFPSRLLTANLV
jgi:hypothetical protein